MKVFSLFLPRFPSVLIYMLQSTEYQVRPYLKWFWQTTDFTGVVKRRSLVLTGPARMLLRAIQVGMTLQLLVGLALIGLWVARRTPGAWQVGMSLVLSYPIIWAHLVVVPLVLGRLFIVKPRERRLIARSKRIFAEHPGLKIAVAGSYGKTTMKELLGTVLSEAKHVAITPANKNVAVSHAHFAAGLKGNEDVLVIEYGEGRPGDVKHFTETTQPGLGVITGLAPAHLDQYPTLEAAGQDIFSLADYLHDTRVYVNAESVATEPFIKSTHTLYSAKGAGAWKVSNVKVGFDGVKFKLAKGKHHLNLHSGLLGRHQIGPLAAVAAIADELGLTKAQTEKGIAETAPFEHRMQPRRLGSAWIIDDTYNGNIDGIKAGLALLKELPARRKIYVTPGLVDQGVETKAVHEEMGRLIAAANPHRVVLMENSVTKHIQAGLKEGRYDGQIELESDPLGFYTGMEHLVAAGDVWLLQNDWTDNYI
jgi:UDP-N-acetylmuramoyl-tripeptide--D-alanyl-D-alanine ligase